MLLDLAKHDKIFEGLIYSRDPLMKDHIQIVIKDAVGSSGTEQVITIPALRAARLGALICEMAITVHERSNR